MSPSQSVSLEDGAAADASISRAEALEARGQLHEALDAFDDAQRRRPSGELAERILQLRLTMVAATSSTPRAEWPPVLPDPFPGVTGVPEVEPAAVTAEVLGGAITHHGGLIVRGMEDPARAAELREMADRAISSRDELLGDAPPCAAFPAGDAEGWCRRFASNDLDLGRERRWVRRTGGMLMVDAPRVMWEVVADYRRLGLIQAIADHFGEPATVSTHKSVLRKAEVTVPTWHQDGSFMGADVRSVDVWLALSPCGPGTDAPGLDLVPARVPSILELVEVPGQANIAISQEAVDATGPAWVSPTFEAGDAVMFDERFVHRTGSDEGTSAARFAIEMWFFAASTVPESYQALYAM